MWLVWQGIQACSSPMDAIREAMEPLTYGSCHRLHEYELVGDHGCSFSQFTCISPTSSKSIKTTLDLLEEISDHFGHPQMLVTDSISLSHSERSSELVQWTWDHTLDSYKRRSQTFGAAIRVCTEKTFPIPEASSSRVLDALPENADILWIHSKRTITLSPADTAKDRFSPAHIAQRK